MDLEDEEWVKVPYDGLLEVHDDGDEKIFSRKYVKIPTKYYKSDHFYTPTTTAEDYVEDESVSEKQFDHKEQVKEIQSSKKTLFESECEPESNQDPIFHVLLQKENQFVEMKMGSLRLSSQESDMSRVDGAPFQHDEKHVDTDDHEFNCSSPSKMIKKEVVAWKESNQGVNIWKWGLSGIGVFCCVGMTVATICTIICGNGRKHKQQNQKLRFQIYQKTRG